MKLDRRAIARRRYEQYELSHETRKLHVTKANKVPMGLNGL